MPSAWTNVDSNFPTITEGGSFTEQIESIVNYMFSLTEELKYTLENLNTTNWNTTAIEDFRGEFTAKIAAIDGQGVRALSLIKEHSNSLAQLQEDVDTLNTQMAELLERLSLVSGNTEELILGGEGFNVALTGNVTVNGKVI